MKKKSLKEKTIYGAGWSFADNILGQGITFLTGLILARLLSPSEYGLIGIITIFINIFNAIVDSGFSSALIRDNNSDDDDYGTMFIVNMGLSFVLFDILFFAAPIISDFFHSSELIPLCRVMGIVVIINATAIIQNTYLTKQLDFKTKTKASFWSSVISGIVGIILAYIGFGVWALVIQQIVRQLLNSILLWYLSNYIVHLNFSLEKFKGMWNFGWKILVSSIVHTVWCELTQIVIGRFYSPTTLGYYTRSNQFSCIFSSNLTSVVQRVSYPALSKIQDDELKLKMVYVKIIRMTMFITFVLMVGMAACAKSIVLSLLGEKWICSIPFLRLLCISMMLYPLNALNLTMLEVKGRSDLYLRVEIAKKIILLMPIAVGILIDIYWMLIANIICSIFCYFINAYYSGRLINYSIIDQVKDLAPSMNLALFLGGTLFCIDSILEISPILLLVIEFVVGVIFVFAISNLLKLEDFFAIKQIVGKFHFLKTKN